MTTIGRGATQRRNKRTRSGRKTVRRTACTATKGAAGRKGGAPTRARFAATSSTTSARAGVTQPPQVTPPCRALRRFRIQSERPREGGVTTGAGGPRSAAPAPAPVARPPLRATLGGGGAPVGGGAPPGARRSARRPRPPDGRG